MMIPCEYATLEDAGGRKQTVFVRMCVQVCLDDIEEFRGGLLLTTRSTVHRTCNVANTTTT